MCAEVCFVLSQFTHLTDRQTDGQMLIAIRGSMAAAQYKSDVLCPMFTKTFIDQLDSSDVTV